MATTYKTPGVFIEEVSTLPASVAPVDTAIPAFIGNTKNGVSGTFEFHEVPVRISSFLQYEEIFGGAPEILVNGTVGPGIEINDTTSGGQLTSREISFEGFAPTSLYTYYAVRSYFANGGGPCYIVSIGDYDTPANDDSDYIAAFEQLEKIDEVTLLCFPDAADFNDTKYEGTVKGALAHCAKMQDRFTIIDTQNDDGDPDDLFAGSTPAYVAYRGLLGVDNLNYGAVYYPYLNTSMSYTIDPDTVIEQKVDTVIGGNYDGLKLGELLTGTGPGLPNVSLHNQIVAQFEDTYSITLPPSGSMAGVYARVDRERGVWKAPANTGFVDVVGPYQLMTDEQQGELNVDANAGKSINAIRSFTGRGTVVWGARTLDGNSNEWRYVSVRRLFLFAEESIQQALDPVVFEPNTANTWTRVKGTISNFLNQLWRQGALAGATPEQAYFVNVGLGVTMTQQDILEGRMIVEVGLAAARPAEFIILRFTHKLQEA